MRRLLTGFFEIIGKSTRGEATFILRGRQHEVNMILKDFGFADFPQWEAFSPQAPMSMTSGFSCRFTLFPFMGRGDVTFILRGRQHEVCWRSRQHVTVTLAPNHLEYYFSMNLRNLRRFGGEIIF